MKRLLSVLMTVFLAVSLTSCGTNNAAPKGSKDNPVRIGVVGASEEQWQVFKAKAEANGIYVDIKDFAEYSVVNPALSSDELDLNEFQHILYLAKYNVDFNANLVPIAATAIYPISLYGDKEKQISELSDLKKDDKVAIPNDGTNQSRAIFLLKSAGLVKLNTDNAIVTPANIIQEESLVEVVPVLGAETPAALSDPKIKAVVVNNDFVTHLSDENQTNILTTESAESKGAEPYINVWVAKNSEDAQNDVFKKVIELFNTDPDVRTALMNSAGGENKLIYASQYTQTDLQKILDLQEQIYKSTENE